MGGSLFTATKLGFVLADMLKQLLGLFIEPILHNITCGFSEFISLLDLLNIQM